MTIFRSFAYVTGLIVMGQLLLGCHRDTGLTVNGKKISQEEMNDSVGDMKQIFSSDSKSVGGLEAKSEIGRQLKEMMVAAGEIETEHDARLAKIPLEAVLSETQFVSKVALEKALGEMNELEKVEGDFVHDKIALAEKYRGLIDSPAFRKGLESSQAKLKTLLEKETAFAEAHKTYLNFGLRVRPGTGKGVIYWPDKDLKQATKLGDDVAHKLQDAVKYANDMTSDMEKSKADFLKTADSIPN